MKIVILSGSSRKNSHTLGLAQAIEQQITKLGQEVELLDVIDLQLPPANPEFHKDPLLHTDKKVVSLAKKLNAADAIVLLSPVYHNSYSGTLKTALDNMAITQFKGKPVALGSNGGDRTSQVVDHLRIVARGLNAIAIPTQVCVQEEDFKETKKGFELHDEKLKARLERLVNELVDITTKLKK